MKDRPIIFSGAMVRAILDGTKTQTRRVIRLGRGVSILGDGNLAQRDDHRCPYGEPGDRLWVKETHQIRQRVIGSRLTARTETWVNYRADAENVERWRPSIYMPRWASRITLELTDVRVQRVQSISEEDARAEGAPALAEGVDDAAAFGLRHTVGFARLWDSINLDRAPWAANPWVWALTFKRVTP